MVRQAVIRSIKPHLRSPVSAYRTISTTALRMAEGDTGGVRAGGQAQGSVAPSSLLLLSLTSYRDAFTKREQASEDYFVRQKEMEKLQILKQKIDEHKKHLEELDKHVADTMAQGKK
ncbi:MAG: hypothetical protein Q9181_006389 [Wetmoreana brouardii]